MKISKELTSFMVVVTMLFGCDKIEQPIVDMGSSGGVDWGPARVDTTCNPDIATATTQRKVLLEEYTGHRCPNCPSATAGAIQVQDNYGSDKMILVGLHVTSTFADPLPPNYLLELRLPQDVEDAYFSEFPAFALPKGLVNRDEYNNSTVLGSGDWSAAIDALINTPAQASILFDTVRYDAATKQLNASIMIQANNDLMGDHHCTIYVVEDHIVGYQQDNTQSPPDVPDYDHRHVVRDVIGGPWGLRVFEGGADQGDCVTYTSSTYALDPSWDVDNISLVAYIHNNDTKEILQVEEAYVIP